MVIIGAYYYYYCYYYYYYLFDFIFIFILIIIDLGQGIWPGHGVANRRKWITARSCCQQEASRTVAAGEIQSGMSHA